VKKYLIVVEKINTGYSVYSPDVPGCGSTGKTKEEVEENIQEALDFHLEGLRQEGYDVRNRVIILPMLMSPREDRDAQEINISGNV
jgi:predicted RNase H-like HicB family nuclease